MRDSDTAKVNSPPSTIGVVIYPNCPSNFKFPINLFNSFEIGWPREVVELIFLLIRSTFITRTVDLRVKCMHLKSRQIGKGKN